MSYAVTRLPHRGDTVRLFDTFFEATEYARPLSNEQARAIWEYVDEGRGMLLAVVIKGVLFKSELYA